MFGGCMAIPRVILNCWSWVLSEVGSTVAPGTKRRLIWLGGAFKNLSGHCFLFCVLFTCWLLCWWLPELRLPFPSFITMIGTHQFIQITLTDIYWRSCRSNSTTTRSSNNNTTTIFNCTGPWDSILTAILWGRCYYHLYSVNGSIAPHGYKVACRVQDREAEPD